MAEIKSTMEMVLARAAKMAEDAPVAATNEDTVKIGMRLAADYLTGQGGDLHTILAAHPPGEQGDIRFGMAQTLLRNIVLPRDEDLQRSSKKGLEGIEILGRGEAEIGTICKELEQILGQYAQHKEQTTQQLEEALKAQIQQQQMAAGQESGDDINPAMHPQYREELTKILTNLNNQYNDAMAQRKDAILQRMAN